MKYKIAFTKKDLIVLLICAGFILLNLAAVGSSGREAAKKAICLANVRGTMLATRSYCSENDGFLPYNGYYPPPRSRNWPHLSIMDFQLLLINAGLDVRKLHCPADQDKPGSIAWWYRDIFNRPIDVIDHFDIDGNGVGDVPLGVEPEVNYSYYWHFKMYMDVKEENGYLQVDSSRKKSWKLSDVRYPARLVTIECFIGDDLFSASPWPHCGKDSKAYMCGFIDGHAELIDSVTRLNHEGMSELYPGTPDSPVYYFDWTPGGIKGYDVIE